LRREIKALWFLAPVWYLVILYRPGKMFIQLLTKITEYLAALARVTGILGSCMVLREEELLGRVFMDFYKI